MHSATPDHLNLAPPQQGRWLGPMGLALVVHGLLVAALTWGVSWKNDAEPAVFEAEIWSRLPQQAAPRAVDPPPAPPPPPPAPEPAPAPRPAPPARPATPPPSERQADIATAQAKKKAEADRQAREEATAQKRAADQAAADKLAADKKAAEKAAVEKVASEKERQQKLAEQKSEQKRQQERQATEKREAALAEQQRQEQLRRIMGQAGASGGAQATGSSQQSSGPSPGYAGRLAARIKPNVVFTDVAPGNPRAEVEVRTLPDGTIVSTKLVKSSGNSAWDEAVLRAIERTASLPRDTDGKVPSALIIGLRPQD